jgi:hypothetical protein
MQGALRTKHDIANALTQSRFHMDALRAVHSLNLPQCYIAAGFVRNYVWDQMNSPALETKLNDIDVIYFDASHHDEAFEKEQELALERLMPAQPWSVKNQARMYHKNGDAPYDDIETALAHWCETVTPIGARLNQDNEIEIIAPLGIKDLLNAQCHATPFAKSKPSKLADYRARMREKKWWVIWPHVTVMDL